MTRNEELEALAARSYLDIQAVRKHYAATMRARANFKQGIFTKEFAEGLIGELAEIAQGIKRKDLKKRPETAEERARSAEEEISKTLAWVD